MHVLVSRGLGVGVILVLLAYAGFLCFGDILEGGYFSYTNQVDIKEYVEHG